MTDTSVDDAQEAIRTGDILRLTQVDDKAGSFAMRLLVEDEPTIDGRYFTSDAVDWRDLPLPLTFKSVNTGDGHKESIACGAIEKLWREGNEIWGSGHFSATDEGQKARQLIKEGVLNGVSADVGGAASEFEADENGGRIQRITKGTVMGATVLPLQAFSEARIAVTAAGAPVEPPKAWFENPHLTQPTAIKVTDDGQVFGHLATWNSCHTGISGRCQMAPHSASDYAFFAHGEVKTAEGDLVHTGRITIGTGHAALSLGAAAAVEHYDNTGTAVADIAVGEDEIGIWFAGALRPDTTAEQVRVLRASAVSGDWRAQNGSLELMALLSVNTPGFPMPRLATLTASAATEDAEEIVTLISANVVRDLPDVQPELATLAASILTTRVHPISRLQEFGLPVVGEKQVSQAQRDKDAKKGTAMPDGSFPINNTADLVRAIRAVGRAKDPAAAKAHIAQRAKALGATKMLPDGFTASLVAGCGCEDEQTPTPALPAQSVASVLNAALNREQITRNDMAQALIDSMRRKG